jgi:hypothetical protein
MENMSIKAFEKEKDHIATRYGIPIVISYRDKELKMVLYYDEIEYLHPMVVNNELIFIETPNYCVEEEKGKCKEFFIWNLADYFFIDLFPNTAIDEKEFNIDAARIWDLVKKVLDDNNISVTW